MTRNCALLPNLALNRTAAGEAIPDSSGDVLGGTFVVNWTTSLSVNLLVDARGCRVLICCNGNAFTTGLLSQAHASPGDEGDFGTVRKAGAVSEH